MDNSLKYIIYEKKNNIAIITVNRPEVLNAINNQLLSELDYTVNVAEEDDDIRAIIITGSGEKAFMAGGDIAAMKEMSLMEGERFVYAGHTFLNKLENSRKTVIAALNGYTLGGGLEIALACDLRVADENVQLGLPEVTIGLYPGWGGTQRLARLVGTGVAKQLVFTGERITANEAKQLGIVNKVVSSGQVLEESLALANRILKNSPIAVMQAKKAINNGIEISLEKALVLEAEAWLVNFATEDRVEGMRAFVDKEKPNYKGR
ncbi:enoyl-CoA hydratase/isomerase family protein [Oceanobacillus longus]|uniref:Enoyl-CoA hydratase/isomerase family protein n=1 Tax=Oceanobacillus longus TaxID=930120 RepID=A0ABV8H258_9BACI